MRIDEIAKLYSEARNYVKMANNLNINKVTFNLKQINAYVKSLAESDKTSIMDRAKSLNLYESLNNIIFIIENNGLTDYRCLAFFGLKQATKEAPSFEEVFKGEATIKAEEKDEPKQINPDDKRIIDDKPIFEQKPKCENDRIIENPDFSIKDYEVLPSFQPECLDDFIGQPHIVKRIKEEIKAARLQGLHHIDHILLFGNRGLGKSTLMKLIAKELGAQFEFMDASQFANDVRSQRAVQKFLQRISELNKPVVIAFDEIHALPKNIQTALLTLLNDRVYSYLDDSGVTHNLEINDFTFIGATTDAQDVLPTIKDRCNNLTFYLKNYTHDELAKIFLNKFSSYKLVVDDVVLDDCINRCRQSIREVDSFVKGLNTKAVLLGKNRITPDMLTEYFKSIDRDPIGLKAKDLEILKTILEDSSGVVSEDTLAARTHLDVKVLNKEFEPYLLSIGFISITPKGRTLTEKAREYLEGGTTLSSEDIQ